MKSCFQRYGKRASLLLGLTAGVTAGLIAVMSGAVSPLAAQAPAQQQTPAPPANPPKPVDGNPFPTDTSTVPVLPNAETPAAAPAPDTAMAPAYVSGNDSDPVHSPDEPVGEPDSGAQGFSSSSAGLDRLPSGADAPDKATRKHGKDQEPVPAHTETAQDDENVAAYYLSSKNWRAALSRYQSALVLDPENPDVYWGLAEAQRHLGDLAQAKENYAKVMAYDPDSKHAKEAKKLLDEPEMAHAVPAHQGQAASQH